VKGERKPEAPRPPERRTAERLGAIVEAAERAAAAVIDEAEAEARRYLAEARAHADRLLAERLGSADELTASLLARAEEIRRQSEGLVAALEQARERLAAEPTPGAGSSPPPEATPRARSRSHLSAVTPVAEPRLNEEPLAQSPPAARAAADEHPGTPAGARLLATQMAVSGSSREEIELRLRNGFEVEDTSAILDAILGPED
jgi:vacuolar-type H+-ATPase subunit H